VTEEAPGPTVRLSEYWTRNWQVWTSPPVMACEGRRWRREAERQGCGDGLGLFLLLAWMLGSFAAFLW
jgi:hypothetical protein